MKLADNSSESEVGLLMKRHAAKSVAELAVTLEKDRRYHADQITRLACAIGMAGHTSVDVVTKALELTQSESGRTPTGSDFGSQAHYALEKQLERDAERYRWLRDNSKEAPVQLIFDTGYFGADVPNTDRIDAVIDESMRQGERTEK